MNRSLESRASVPWLRRGLAVVVVNAAIIAVVPAAAAQSKQDLAVRPEALLARPGDDVEERVVLAGTLRSPGVSRWQIEWRGFAISVTPLPEIHDSFDEWSRWAVGKEVLIEGRLRRDGVEPRVDFWIYEFPKQFEEEFVEVPLVSVMDLMTDGETYSGKLVRVRGVRIEGDGHLSKESRRDGADWVLRDDCCDLWVSGAGGRSAGSPRKGDDDGERLDVVGRAEITAGLVHLIAENVVPAPPEMPARIKLGVTSESGSGFAPVCGKALVRVTILGDVPAVPLMWTLYVATEKRSSGAVPFLYEGVLKREHEIIEHVVFAHFQGAFIDDGRRRQDSLFLEDSRNNRPAAEEARRLRYELILSERDTGREVASGEARVMVDCFPPLCSPTGGCRR